MPYRKAGRDKAWRAVPCTCLATGGYSNALTLLPATQQRLPARIVHIRQGDNSSMLGVYRFVVWVMQDRELVSYALFVLPVAVPRSSPPRTHGHRRSQIIVPWDPTTGNKKSTMSTQAPDLIKNLRYLRILARVAARPASGTGCLLRGLQPLQHTAHDCRR